MIKAKLSYIICILAYFIAFCKQDQRIIINDPQYSNPVVHDSITYELINEALAQDFEFHNFPCRIVSDKLLFSFSINPEDSLKLTKMDSLFTKEDISYIYQQARWNANFKLNPKLMIDWKVIDSDSIQALKNEFGSLYFKEFRQKYGEGGFCYISMPLFKKDKSVAIVKKGMACGTFCAEHQSYIFKRLNNKWQRIYGFELPEEH